MLPETIRDPQQEGELPPEVLESSVARSVAGEAGRINIRFQRSASVPSSFEALHDALGAQMQTPLGSRGFLSTGIASVQRDRTTRAGSASWAMVRCAWHSTMLPIAWYQAAQGCSQLKSWAGADRQHEQRQGAARRPTSGEHAGHACKSRLLSWTGSAKQFGQATLPGLLETKCFSWTMDHKAVRFAVSDNRAD